MILRNSDDDDDDGNMTESLKENTPKKPTGERLAMDDESSEGLEDDDYTSRSEENK